MATVVMECLTTIRGLCLTSHLEILRDASLELGRSHDYFETPYTCISVNTFCSNFQNTVKMISGIYSFSDING